MRQQHQDAWDQHLAKYNLVELDALAQQSGYRVRVANDYIFDLEPTSGFTEFKLKTYDNTDAGKVKAIRYLTIAKILLEALQEEHRLLQEREENWDVTKYQD